MQCITSVGEIYNLTSKYFVFWIYSFIFFNNTMVPWICFFFVFCFFGCYFGLISNLNATIRLSPIFFCFMFFLLINIYKINITFLCCLPDMYLKLCRKMLTLFLLLGKKRYWVKWSMLLIIFPTVGFCFWCPLL
jgi:hypothetical protein